MAKLDGGFVKRGNVWQIRKIIPLELRPSFEEREGRKPRAEYTKSLRTADPKQA